MFPFFIDSAFLLFFLVLFCFSFLVLRFPFNISPPLIIFQDRCSKNGASGEEVARQRINELTRRRSLPLDASTVGLISGQRNQETRRTVVVFRTSRLVSEIGIERIIIVVECILVIGRIIIIIIIILKFIVIIISNKTFASYRRCHRRLRWDHRSLMGSLSLTISFFCHRQH